MGIVWALLAGLQVLLPANGGRDDNQTERLHIVTFDSSVEPDMKARELCLLHGCIIHHVYRTLPGMAVSRGNLAAIMRSGGVLGVEDDLPVHMAEDSPVLIGAPSHAPLAVLAGALDTRRLIVERSWQFPHGTLPKRQEFLRTTRLLEGLVRRQPERAFWSFQVLDFEGNGRLSDLLSALDQLAGLRFAIAAVFVPLQVEGQPPPILCEMIDKVLRKGLLVITDVDAACSHL